MKWKRAKMKLSDNTVQVLKNFSTINQNLKIGIGNTLATMSAMKNIVAQATVEETFERDVAIYDLNEFLASMSLFDKPELDFHEDFLVMWEGDKLQYFYSDPSVVTTVTKEISMPSIDVTFTLSSEELSNITKAAAVIGAPDMILENGSLKVTDKKNSTANHYSKDVSVENQSGSEYGFWFKVENLKLMPGTYEVSVSSKKISHFKNINADLEYFIALEPESYYG